MDGLIISIIVIALFFALWEYNWFQTFVMWVLAFGFLIGFGIIGTFLVA